MYTHTKKKHRTNLRREVKNNNSNNNITKMNEMGASDFDKEGEKV